MERGSGNGSNAACVCLDSSWGRFTPPSHSGSFPLVFLSGRSRSQTATAGEEEEVLANGGRGSKKQRAGSVLHVLSRDLPWRALQGQKEALESVYSRQDIFTFRFF